MEQMNLLRNGSASNGGYVHVAGQGVVLHNLTISNTTEAAPEEKWLTLNELQMIKVIVLVIVVGILLLSTCKIVFKTFSRYSGKRLDHM